MLQERPDLANLKSQLTVSNAKMKKELQDIEDKILHMLSNSQVRRARGVAATGQNAGSAAPPGIEHGVLRTGDCPGLLWAWVRKAQMVAAHVTAKVCMTVYKATVVHCVSMLGHDPSSQEPSCSSPISR